VINKLSLYAIVSFLCNNFQDCVMSALENKTVILVTHQVEFLAKVDRILVSIDQVHIKF
jgi:ABC-type transport system involved in cytochrome bd biosynthesis fused ATPase/permease subunit